ncbi:prominin-1-A-like [Ruditapes philippinarum]|uniref:prominin-1-A-like n=1 Tax=Ruditapes philippinarum TaxID=129788 RepID=UPI00295A9B6E|nr:prominin-1-A-like [Ruditapes philippinarum]
MRRCFVLTFILVYFVGNYHVIYTEAAVSDKWGNNIADDGTITWVDIPVGNLSYVTTNSYDDGGLGQVFAFSRSFINTVQPGGFPLDVLEKALNGSFDIGKDYMQLVDYSMGFAICFAIGLLFVVLLPLCGCCICCCRCCCGNCGGDLKAVYNKNEDCKRMGLAQALFLMVILMAGAAGCVWMTNGRFSVAIDYTENNLITNLDDLETFFANIVDQFKYLSSDMYNLIQTAIIDDITDIGGVIETAIFNNLGIDAVVNAVIQLDGTINNISDALDQVISDQNTFISATNNLTTAMNDLGTAIDTTKTTCSSSGVACQTACDNMDTTALKSGAADFSSLPDLSSVKSSVDDVKNMNLSDIAQAANASIQDVSNVINNNTAAIKTQINDTMNEFAGTIGNMTNDLLDALNGTVDSSGLKSGLGDFFGMIKGYDTYRVYFGYALTGLFTIIVVLALLGICCGCLGQDSDKLPTERGFMSNLGGCLLIIPVIMMFIVGSLLMLLTTLTFMVGGNMEKLCQPMQDLTLFSEFIDKGAISGLSIGVMLHNNESYNLGFYDLLLGCRANKAPFKLLGLNHLLPIEQYLNHSQYTSTLSGDMSGMTSIDLTSFSILTPEMETALTDMQNSGVTDIDFAAINSTLSQDLVSVDFNSLITAMETIRDSCSGATYTRWDNHVNEMKTIRDVKLPEVSTAQANLKTSVANLEVAIGGLDASLNNTLTTARQADDQLQNNVTAVITDAINDFVVRITSYLEQFANEALDIVYNEIGRCLPLWNLYDSLTSIICKYMVESLNAFWFGTGWGLLFFIPVMVLSMKLSKYYRRMDKQEGFKEEEDPLDEDIDDFEVRYDMMRRQNKVAPDPDFID